MNEWGEFGLLHRSVVSEKNGLFVRSRNIFILKKFKYLKKSLESIK